MCWTLLCVAVPSWTTIGDELEWTFEDFNNSYAMALAATGICCIFLIPIAIDFGRRPIYMFSIALMILVAAWSAKMNQVWELYVTQIIMGIASSTAEITIQMTIADMFFVHERASMNAMYLVFCYLGNNMSQVAGGYITLHQGWRWNYWWCLIFVSCLELLVIFTFEETKYVSPSSAILNELKTQLSFDHEAIQEPIINSKRPWVDSAIAKRPLKQRLALVTITPGPTKPLWRKWVGPFVILVRFPVVTFIAFQYGLSVAWTCIMSTTASQYLGKQPYNFTSAAIGNINISPFVGTVLGTVLGGLMCDWSVIKLAKWNDGVFKPEMRLYSAILPAMAMTGSLFMYGYGIGRQENWAVPIVAYGLASFGGTAMSNSILTYLMDSYREIIGQSLIGVVFIQNLIPTAMVFALQPWIRAIGIINVLNICGGISVLAILVIIPMILYGKRIRKRTLSIYNTFRISYIRS